ncbi:23S rRNA (uracil(1939)-C(5))-methyltransferase RlmD [Marinobacterium arenosum]|uniref:23S rRNA (uracil(1939)-C(5))-methyltransferase RlmD n=1 Tax=Marinobacterium arenosum TaxID=2862496 RepID=UPI001C95BE59|nr:23S rRNA (uracil(1939)-C(5))-methyltransferase RlmD [Marinobacterium arenosum]MBY4675282.1 23S rRNA (uracil(1939)-C(5))-methyltransferase RlmD [Marinobacterium arenosum]
MRQRIQFGRPQPRRSKTPQQPLSLSIDKLSHEGRGIARHEGKTVFVEGALPGEQVTAKISQQHRRYDEAECLSIEQPSDQRATPGCPHFGSCGGCQLQHLSHDEQIHQKQQWVLEQLERLGGLQPEQVEPPLTSDSWHYRRAARIGINQRQDGSSIVGFRRRNSNRITALEQCPVLDQRGEPLFRLLSELLDQHGGSKQITHAELSYGDQVGALTLRVKKCPGDALLGALKQLASEQQLNLYLDHGERIEIVQQAGELTFSLPEFNQTLEFAPGDFIQVNDALNRQMIVRALDWLAPTPEERVLDLFCGLGNFTLPLASRAASVIGIEGSERMVERARANAARNGLDNCRFEAADLSQPIRKSDWFKAGFDKVLLDPPRTGALELVRQLIHGPADQLLYVSCNPAALARDGGELHKAGFRLTRFCVMDMFPQTTHVESLALFVRQPR